eukprot:gene7698-15754_t
MLEPESSEQQSYGNYSPSREERNGSPDYESSPDGKAEGYANGSSQNSQVSKQSSRRKKAKTPVTIEEVFTKVSVITSSNINPPPARIVLTPRSAEVCLKYGINPEVLKVRDIDSFWESGIDPSVQRLRHEAYVHRRYDLMKKCRAERKRLINAELNRNEQSSFSHEGPSVATLARQQQDEMNATIIENEKLRLEKLRRRQEKELEQMLQYEINRVKTQKEIEKRLETAKKQETMRQKQLEKRMKLVAEERRLKDLQRAAMAEAEEAQQRELAKHLNQRERQIAEDQQRRIEEQKAKLRKEEEEKHRRHAEHKLQVQKFFADQQATLQERFELMTLKEQQKEQDALRKQQEKRQKMIEKRNAIEERIERNIQAAEIMEEKRKEDFLSKQEEFEETRLQQQERLEMERQLKIQEQKLQEQRRRMIILQQRREEECKKNELLGKFNEDEQHVLTIQEMKKKELEIIAERRNLRMQMKAENVNRVKRVNDYSALKTLKKIEDADMRTQRMLEERQALIEQRKRYAAEARRQKEAMVRAMEALRSDASEADKVLKNALSGKVTLSEIVKGGTNRPVSVGRIRKNKSKNKTTSELLGISRANKSAGDTSDIDLHTHLHSNRQEDEPAPLPYVSPYDSSFHQEGASAGGGGGGDSQRVTL